MPLYLVGDRRNCATCGRAMRPHAGYTRTRGHTRPKALHLEGGPLPGNPALRHDPKRPHCYLRPYVWQCSACNRKQANRTLRQWEYDLRIPVRNKGLQKQYLAQADVIATTIASLLTQGLCPNDL